VAERSVHPPRGAPEVGRGSRATDADADADADGGAAAMKVLVLCEGTRHQVQIAGTQSAGELCAKLEPLIGIAAESMTLTLGREPLCLELPLAEQGVQDRDRLTCSRHAAVTSSAVLESAMQEVEACSAALDELGEKVAAAASGALHAHPRAARRHLPRWPGRGEARRPPPYAQGAGAHTTERDQLQDLCPLVWPRPACGDWRGVRAAGATS